MQSMSDKNKQSYDIVVIGLGYVGLTLATAFASIGVRTLGVEKRKEVVDLTNQGKAHFSEFGLDELLLASVEDKMITAVSELPSNVVSDTYIITVGTPLDSSGNIRMDMIQNASVQVANNMSNGSLVILRSTVKIGTTRNIVGPILAETGKKFNIAMCPERTLEGKAMEELRRLPQIIGADDVESRARCVELFSQLTKSVIQVGSLESAEMTKLVDNTYRDVQFAFANEVARACEVFGVNASEIINAGKMGYERTNVASPGLVGGPCLEKDPHIFNQSVMDYGISLDITAAARKVNERQPLETVDTIFKKIKSRSWGDNIIISILGIAFKGVPETDDLRGAMSLKVIDAIIKKNTECRLKLFDPIIKKKILLENFPDAIIEESLEDAISDAHVVIISNNHPLLGSMHPKIMLKLMAKRGFIYDYWNHFSDIGQSKTSNSYFALGNTKEVDL
jgi:UDP-N-acetyl-D-mannosaminuronic acid dehydrogenase